MSNSYISGLVAIVGPYSAEYAPTPITEKPSTGCDLPTLLPLPVPPANPTLPDSSCCTPTFIPFPIIPAPFVPPENCLNGLTFTTTNVSILAQQGGNPVATIPIGINQSSDFCTYDLDIPPIIIPCYPTGPTLTIQPIVISDPYTSGYSTGTSLTSTVSGNCAITITPPPINIPCYPGGIQFSPIKFLTPYNWTDTGINPSGPVKQQVGSGCTVVITSINAAGTITGINMTSGGQNYIYTNPPTFQVVGPTGSGAILQITGVSGGAISNVLVFNGGIGYTMGETTVNVIPPQAQNLAGIAAGHQVLDFSNNGALRNPLAPCTWGDTTVVFPMPDCTGGFLTSTSGFNVKVNGTPLSGTANTVSLNRNSTTDTNGNNVCILNLGGEIDLSIPTAICPTGIGITTTDTTTPGSSNSYQIRFNDITGSTFASTSLVYNSCTLSFENDAIIPGLVQCNSGFATPSTSITFQDATGNPVSNGSNLTFSGTSLCNLSLSGLIKFPTASNPVIPYIGSGPPSGSTLSGSYSYTATQPPSLYIDTNGLGLYYCSTSGSNSTSGWTQISGGGGGGVWI